MSEITVFFRDGTNQVFSESHRPGGSFTNSIRYEGDFAIIKDAWDKQTAFPAELIQRIESTERRGW